MAHTDHAMVLARRNIWRSAPLIVDLRVNRSRGAGSYGRRSEKPHIEAVGCHAKK
jgi:hypothetical protein